MKLLMVGVNHEILNLDDRKKFYFRESDKYAFSTLLLDEMIDQTVILSTCNRSEVYVFVEDDFEDNKLKQIFLQYFHQKDTHLYLKSGKKAILYLLEVACGLKSMVIGEDQILHQIKEAYNWALQQHFTGKEMNYLFNQVLSFAKKMKREYAISNHPLSLSYIGYQYIKDDLHENDRIMICGAGEMAQLMMDYLKDYQIFVVNRTYENVKDFLNEKRKFVAFDDRYDYIDQVKLIVSATGSPHVIFKDENIHVDHELVFLDLAMPRDIDIRLSKRYKVIDMDTLQLSSKAQLEKRKEIAQKILDECHLFLDSLVDGMQSMKSDNLIQRMQERYINISDETYELLNRKLSLTSKEQYLLKKILKTSFLRLLKDPVRLLKEGNQKQQEQYIELLDKMISGEKER